MHNKKNSLFNWDEVTTAVINFVNGRKNGDSFLGLCPAHEDKDASLSVKPRSGKSPLLKCFAGCEYEKVRAAFVSRGVWPDFTTREPAREPARREQWQLVATYIYRDSAGAEIFRKRRFKKPDGKKTFVHSRIVNGVEVKKDVVKGLEAEGVTIPLYNLPELLAAISNKQQILICEGEKDCDAAMRAGFVATTNHAGASAWHQADNEIFRGADIIIVEDNDNAGRKRSAMLSTALLNVAERVRVLQFPELPEKGDLFDYLQSHEAAALQARIDALSPVTTTEIYPWDTAGKDDRATHQDYIRFVKTRPGICEIRRCELLDDLLARRDNGDWIPVGNLEDYVKGCARDYGRFFTGAAFREHLERYRIDECKPQLIIDVPAWDGVDRIRQMADVFRFSNVSQECFFQLMCSWGATVFQRLKDSSIQPITPVFQGAQGLGKDSLIAALAGGFGPYFRNLRIDSRNPVEAEKQLHTALVFRIPEFDRTARSDIATLKYLLNTDVTDVRLSYDRRDQKRHVRASFIASCNIEDILADHTGNRRYWVFNAEYLGLHDSANDLDDAPKTEIVRQDYPGLFSRENYLSERMQILAQYRELAAKGFRPSQSVVREMAAYVRGATPEDPNDLMLGEIDSMIQGLQATPARYSTKDGAPLYRLEQIAEQVESIARSYGRSKQKVLHLMGLKGMRERYKAVRMYRSRMVTTSNGGDDLPF